MASASVTGLVAEGLATARPPVWGRAAPTWTTNVPAPRSPRPRPTPTGRRAATWSACTFPESRHGLRPAGEPGHRTSGVAGRAWTSSGGRPRAPLQGAWTMGPTIGTCLLQIKRGHSTAVDVNKNSSPSSRTTATFLDGPRSPSRAGRPGERQGGHRPGAGGPLQGHPATCAGSTSDHFRGPGDRAVSVWTVTGTGRRRRGKLDYQGLRHLTSFRGRQRS